MITIKALYDQENRQNRFLAAIQGVDLDGSGPDSEGETKTLDVTSLKGNQANQAGFGIGFGLGHVEEV